MKEIILKPRRFKWIKRLVLAILGFLIGTFIGFGLNDVWDGVPQWLAMTIGLILMAYCVVMILMARSALSSNNKGMTFSKTGILDESSIIGYGEMPWKEITGITIEEKPKHPRLLVMIKQPKSMIDRSSNNAIKGLRQKNLEQFGTPVIIDTESFDVDMDELITFLEDRKTSINFKKF